MIKDNKLPLYELMISEDDSDATGVEFISLVDNPAIEVHGFAFSQVKDMKVQFSAVDDKQIIVGPAMIPDKLIYRRDGDIEYNVFFTADTIRKMQQKFNRGNNNKAINVDHSERMVDGYIQENWIVESKEFDKSKMYGYDLPIGTWFVSVKIEDKEFWLNEVKELGKFSFSIEGLLAGVEIKNNKQPNVEQLLDKMLDELFEELFMGKKIK